MPMMENRVQYVIILFVLFFGLQMLEFGLENVDTENPDVSFDKDVMESGDIGIIETIVDALTIDTEGMPFEFSFIFSIINLISLFLISVIIVTWAIDAFPFTGG